MLQNTVNSMVCTDYSNKLASSTTLKRAYAQYWGGSLDGTASPYIKLPYLALGGTAEKSNDRTGILM